VVSRRFTHRFSLTILDGGTEYNYPSAYSSVVSVAAVDQSMQRAYFSQANDRVDLAAPGVSVLSTIPISSSFPGVIKVNLQGSSHLATNMAFGANLPSLGITATISLCEAGGEDGCPDVSENICLIER
jgi:subtilisin family serine protease